MRSHPRVLRPLTGGRWLYLAAVLAVASFALSLMTAPEPVFAAPGTPGTPQAPILVFEEDFENGMDPTAVPIMLDAYTGAGGETYTAHANWIDPAQCNGFIVSASSPDHPGGCSAGNQSSVRTLANTLGTLNGSADPTANFAVAAYTAGNPGADNIQFATEDALSVAIDGRFLIFSVNVAAINCGVSAPQLQFALTDGVTEFPATTAPINPCPSGGSGTFATDGSVLFTGTDLGIVMRNANGNGGGNDHAFDDIRILDATPQLDKAFAPANPAVGGVSTLTFTVTNTTDLAAKAGWSFTDTLPAGLTVASPGNATTTCTNGTVTAPDGGNTIAVSGDLDAGHDFCTITVDVTSATAATYTNGAANITASVGLNDPGDADVTFGVVPPVSTLPTFACTPEAYLFQNAPTDAFEVDLVSGVNTEVATDFNDVPAGSGGNINGIGYNVLDDYIYGWDLTLQEIVRVGSDFSVESLGVPPGYTGGTSVIGDVDENGQYWFIGRDSNWYQVDLSNPASATYMEIVDQGPSTGVTGLAGNDWAYVPAGDALYRITTDGATGDGLLWEFDRATGAWSGGTSVGVDIAQVGAAYADNDYLYVSVNASGAIYRIDVLTGVGEHFSPGPAASSNDGTRCFEARIDIDLGDAPNTYGTLVGADGARHSMPGYDDTTNTATYMLGSTIDTEVNGQPGALAEGDDTVDADNVDDEDGVEFNPALAYATPTLLTGTDPVTGLAPVNELSVEVSEDGFVSAWVDWDLDGTFSGAGEQVVSAQPVTAGGPHALTFAQPTNPNATSTYVRVRFASTAADVANPTGTAADGEVEDYRVQVQRLLEPQICINTSSTFYAFTFGAPVDLTGGGGPGTSARFEDVAVIDGVAVDMIATVVSGDLTSGNFFSTSVPGPGDDIAWNIVASGATVEYSFVDDSGAPVPVNGVFIANDMDGGEVATFSAADLADYGVTPGSAVSVLESGGNVVFSGSGSNNSDPPSRFQVVLENVDSFQVQWQGFNNSGFMFDGDQDLAVPIECDPELTVTKESSDPDSLTPGGTVDYTVTVENTGDIDASGTVIEDELADGIASGTWVCTAAGGAACPSAAGVMPLNETIATLPVGGSVEYVITATLEATLPPVVVQTVTADPPGDGGSCAPDGAPEPCSATVTNPPVPVVSISKTTTTVGTQPGDTITYEITARNAGSVPADGTQVADPGAAGLEGVTWGCTATGGAACPTASGTGGFDETIATFPAGSSVTWTVTGTVSNDPPATISNTAVLTPFDPTPLDPDDDPICLDGSAAPCTSTTDVPVTISPSLEVLKDADVDSMSDLGSRDREIEYTFTVTNTGDVVLSGVTVSDPLAGLSPISCTPGAGPVIGTMQPGDVAICTATFEVDSAAYRGGVTNVATVTGDTSRKTTVTDTGTSNVPGRPFPPDDPDIPTDPDPTPTPTPTSTPTVTPTPDPTDTPTPTPTPEGGDDDDGGDGDGSDSGSDGDSPGDDDESRGDDQGPPTPAETGYGLTGQGDAGSLALSGLAALVVALGAAALRRFTRPIE